jgi:endonuclease YncB( thermonuclease family)
MARELVRAGLALAYRRYALDYVEEEEAAKAARAGIWVGDFTPPEEWRRRNR